MKIIVTGLECSGTKWMTSILGRHPDVAEAVHTSIPQELHPDTHWPHLEGADAVVWMIRYEPIRLLSLQRTGYDLGRSPEFLPPALYEKAVEIYRECKPRPVLVSYEAMLSPLWKVVLRECLESIGLAPLPLVHEGIDGNLKYLSPISNSSIIHT